ncbi:MAG: hypothetical protein JNK82_27350 [Myxococcaceae bacterium]|nr:hypothetical protein [Myxococcaceae bacterium]
MLRRGQTLALFALTLLLLVVMVTMTLSFGTKAKEKMELQQVADQAAYSTSIATARGMNVLAMTNRVMLAHMVAMLGLISSSSFASMWIGVVDGMLIHYTLDLALAQAPRCNPPWQWCGCIGLIFEGIRYFLTWIEFFRVFFTLASLDIPVANAANRASLAVMYMYLSQVETHFLHTFTNNLDGERTSERVMRRSTTGPEWEVNGGAADVAQREVGRVPYVDGALNVSSLIASDRHAVMAAMGARGHPWTAGRGNPISQAPMILRTKALATFGADLRLILNEGNGYFGAPFHTNNMFVTRSTAAVADDHSQWNGNYTGAGCQPGVNTPVFAAAFVWSNAIPGYWVHLAGTGFGLPAPFAPVVVVLPTYFDNFHPISGACILNCPSAWTNFVDYNLWKVMDQGDNFAQPKIPVTVTRNMHNRPGGPDPWNLTFNFRFNPSGAGQRINTVDRDGIMVRNGTTGWLDISRQTALSTGVVYYHRQGHWREPPNLFNPYWRGGLTRSDIDDQARSPTGDIHRVLRDSNVNWAADTYTALYNAGFRGLQ